MFSLLVAIWGIAFTSAPLTIPIFMSEESKTMDLKPVYNTITYTPKKNGDWWVMDQSHQGINAAKKNWDRIAIFVDKATKPYTARYYQIESGGTKEIVPKVQCFICHTNGPRAIRPDASNNLAIGEKVKIQYLNLKIKMYGPMNVSTKQTHRIRYPMDYANRELKIPTCMKCHNNDSMFGRGKLYFQNLATIKSMIDREHMPPMGFKMTEEDKKLLKQYSN